MSAATIARRCAEVSERSLLDDVLDGELTLEQLIAGVWEELAVKGTARCPVCGEPMRARRGAGARRPDHGAAAQGEAERGRCAGCGATLS